MTFNLPATKMRVPAHQPDATLSQSNPVSATLYTVLDTTKNVRILGIVVKCTWSVQATALSVRLTIDGNTLNADIANPVSNTWYFFYKNLIATGTLGLSDVDDYGEYPAFLHEGRSVKVEVMVTGGTVSNLASIVKYAKIG